MTTDDGDTGPTSDLSRLAGRVAREGVVHLSVRGTHLVCLTEEAFERVRRPDASTPATGGGTRPVHLSPREVQVLRLVGSGLTAAETAALVGIAVNTVSQHLVSARRRYRVTSTRAAVEAARRDGLL